MRQAMKKARDNKKYTREDHFIYEWNYFHDYFRAIPFLRVKKMLDKAGIYPDGKSILIASCGCGIDAHYLLKSVRPGKIYFSDIDPGAAEKTLSNFHEEAFIIADNEQLSFKDDSFDYVFVAASLHHLREPLRGLYELLRVSKRALIVIEPNDTFLTRIFQKLGLAREYEVESGNYVYRFDKGSIMKLAKARLFKCHLDHFFSTHKVAKSKMEFALLKFLNFSANLICPGAGNYIIFAIVKEEQPIKAPAKRMETAKCA